MEEKERRISCQRGAQMTPAGCPSERFGLDLRIRSRVTLNICPTSSERVLALLVVPKRMRMTYLAGRDAGSRVC
jgi:hypothetical protein